jgi:hypothetical protein
LGDFCTRWRNVDKDANLILWITVNLWTGRRCWNWGYLQHFYASTRSRPSNNVSVAKQKLLSIYYSSIIASIHFIHGQRLTISLTLDLDLLGIVSWTSFGGFTLIINDRNDWIVLFRIYEGFTLSSNSTINYLLGFKYIVESSQHFSMIGNASDSSAAEGKWSRDWRIQDPESVYLMQSAIDKKVFFPEQRRMVSYGSGLLPW